MLSYAKTKVLRLYLILTILYEDWLYLKNEDNFKPSTYLLECMIGSYETGSVCKYYQGPFSISVPAC